MSGVDPCPVTIHNPLKASLVNINIGETLHNYITPDVFSCYSIGGMKTCITKGLIN